MLSTTLVLRFKLYNGLGGLLMDIVDTGERKNSFAFGINLSPIHD